MSSAIAAMPISSTIEMSSAMQYRQTGSRSRSSHLNRHGNRRPSADDANLDNAGALEGLYSDNEDESFEVPDFHFDWGVAKEKTRTEMGSRVENNLEALTLSHLAVGETRRVPSAEMAIPRADTTPPPRPLQSTQSSSSSAHIMSLTDASTASASSMIPTPPNPNSATNSGALSSHGSESSASGGGHPGRMYGVRSFQRVVSAPLTRQRYEGERVVAANDDISVSFSLIN